MSKICTVCGYNCEDSVMTCPVCGSPFTVPSQSVVPPASVMPNPGQNGIPQIHSQFVPPNAYVSYPQGPAMQGQNMQMEPPKKQNKTLWIVLGITGGVLLLLILSAIILMFFFRSTWRSRNIPVGNTSTGISHTNHHDYYYDDYNNASFHSETFVDITTEDPSTIPSTEVPDEPDDSRTLEDFREEDLIIYSVEPEGTEPVSYAIQANCSYTIGTSTGLLQTRSGSVLEPAEFTDKHCQLGRNIPSGSSIDDCIAAYGIDTTNAIWQLYENSAFEYYYYSTTIRPDRESDSALIFGWYQTGDTWQRMYPVDLFNYWQKGMPPECDNILMYILYTDDSGESISSMNIMYGSYDYFDQFYTSWTQVQDMFNEME